MTNSSWQTYYFRIIEEIVTFNSKYSSFLEYNKFQITHVVTYETAAASNTGFYFQYNQNPCGNNVATP